MAVGPSWSAHRAFAAAVSERRIYIRTERGTRHFSLSPITQAAGLLLVAALLGWTAFASTAYVTRALDAYSADSRLQTQRAAYEARLAALAERQLALEEELAQANGRRDAVTARLSDKQARLVEASARLQAATAELVALREQVETLTAARREQAGRIAALEAEVAGLESALAAAATEMANLDTAFDTFTAAMERVIAERDSAAAEAGQLRQQVVALSGNLGNLRDRQQRLVSRLEDAARTTFAGLKSLFARSDLDLERILAEARRDYNGAGGPFVPLGEGDEARAAEGDMRVAALMQELETVNLMRFAADRLPFGEPVRGARLTSDFGPRRDPKGRGRSMHEGVDLAGPPGTPIAATADGIVTYAGRQSGYGIVVKIRHAFGFETVYAHLNRARVKVGQRVARGDRIGDMGNTGRSTGTHVHYEVRIDDKPVNPLKFIEAARDVL
jgi:murein DD-endopeptidase MepM/ murein hydrolase activator NlpD